MRVLDLRGVKFGRWTVLQYVGSPPSGRKGSVWLCQCSCGSTPKRIDSGNLRAGRTESCGCLRAELTGNRFRTHGLRDDKVYNAFKAMHRRVQKLDNYGGRGIRVCKRWSGPKGLQNFIEDVGHPPSKFHSLDRYPDNDGDYKPGNVRWATAKQQARNTRANVVLKLGDQEKCLTAWAEYLGIPLATVRSRYRRGLNVEEILSTRRLK